jgi:hypothetical protein
MFENNDTVINNYPEQSIFLKSLLGVVSKLELFVQIVDNTAKVSVQFIAGDLLLNILIGTSICKYCVAGAFIAIPGSRYHYRSCS